MSINEEPKYNGFESVECKGIFGHIFGHKYSPVYIKEYTRESPSFKGIQGMTALDLKMIIESSRIIKDCSEYSICKRCGHIINKK